MSKTLDRGILVDRLIEKFTRVAYYCGAKTVMHKTAGTTVVISAAFDTPLGWADFVIRLQPGDQRFLIDGAYVTVNGNYTQNYADPEVVLHDLGKEFFEKGDNNWEIATPANLVAFLEDYARLEQIYNREKLFARLLD